MLHWVLMFAATHWPQINRYKPRTGWPMPFFSEAVHLALYAVWGGLWWRVLSRSPKGASTRALSNVLLGGFFYACFDEATQLIVGRGGKSYDVLVDTVGIAAALSLLEGWRRYRDSR